MSVEPIRPSLFEDSVSELLARAQCRRVMDEGEKEDVYRLRYRSYLREGAVGERADERFEDDYDRSANSWTFAVYVDGALASSVRLSVSGRHAPPPPAAHVFPDILAPMLEKGLVVVDPTRFVVDADLARLHPKLPYVTVRVAWLALDHYGADVSLATVRAEHQAFYRRLFGHRLICPARPYPSLLKPISVMALDYSEAERARVEGRYPFLRAAAGERERLFGSTPHH